MKTPMVYREVEVRQTVRSKPIKYLVRSWDTGTVEALKVASKSQIADLVQEGKLLPADEEGVQNLVNLYARDREELRKQQRERRQRFTGDVNVYFKRELDGKEVFVKADALVSAASSPRGVFENLTSLVESEQNGRAAQGIVRQLQ
eukprot:gene40538-49414_t